METFFNSQSLNASEHIFYYACRRVKIKPPPRIFALAIIVFMRILRRPTPPSSSGLGRRVLIPETGVRFPLGVPILYLSAHCRTPGRPFDGQPPGGGGRNDE